MLSESISTTPFLHLTTTKLRNQHAFKPTKKTHKTSIKVKNRLHQVRPLIDNPFPTTALPKTHKYNGLNVLTRERDTMEQLKMPEIWIYFLL